MDKKTYGENLSIEQRQELAHIEISLKNKEYIEFNSLAVKLDVSESRNFSKALKDLGLKYIPVQKTREKNHVNPMEYEIARFGEAVLNSKFISLPEKKQFIRYLDAINPKYSKVAVSLYNVNNMNRDKCRHTAEKRRIKNKIHFYELLSFFAKNANIKSLKDENLGQRILDDFPTVEHKTNYAFLLANTLKTSVVKHRIRLKKFDGDMNKYINAMTNIKTSIKNPSLLATRRIIHSRT